MTKYCIKLIKKCTESDPSNRPSFDEIIEDMKNNSFKLAEGIDSNVINHRYQKLINTIFTFPDSIYFNWNILFY